MVRSRGIATTLSAITVFSVLLVANAFVFQGENDRLNSARLASYENEEAFLSAAQSASAVYSDLANVQSYLVSQPPRCSDWDAYAASLSYAQNYSGIDDRIYYSVLATSSYVTGGGSDNLSMLSPFDGSLQGSLNLAVILQVRESLGPFGSLPSYSKTETHYSHLPIALDDALSICSAAMSDLASLPPPVPSKSGECPDLSGLLDSIREEYSALASPQGLVFGLTTAPLAGSACGFSYTVTLSQQAEGVSGPFLWHTFDGGSLP